MEQLKHNFPFAKEVEVVIPLTTAYKWGYGWCNFEDMYSFQLEVYPKITDAGYILNKSEDGSSPTITKNDWRSRMSLYLHPMEITGYATIEDVNKIIDILHTCKSVYEVGEPEITNVYNISDSDYEHLLVANSKEILDWIKEKSKKGSTVLIGFEFADEFRIPRIGDSSLRLCSDVDVHFIHMLQDIATNLGLLKTEK